MILTEETSSTEMPVKKAEDIAHVGGMVGQHINDTFSESDKAASKNEVATCRKVSVTREIHEHYRLLSERYNEAQNRILQLEEQLKQESESNDQLRQTNRQLL